MIRDVYLVAGREIAQKLRDRAFLMFTGFMLLLPIIGGLVGGLAAGGAPGPAKYSVGVVGESGRTLGGLIDGDAPTFGLQTRVERLPDARAALKAVTQGDLDAAVIDGERMISGGASGADLEALVQSSARRLQGAETLRRFDVPPEGVRAALDPARGDATPLAVERVAEGDDPGTEWIVGSVGPILLFITVMTYGFWIANGVVEEKSSRVVEVVLAALHPNRLLAGKVLGIGLLGLAQLTLLTALGLGAASGTDVELPPGTLGVAGSILLWFFLGFAFYGCLFAVAGSLVSKQEDIQYTQLPIMVLLFAGYGTAFYGTDNPGSTAVALLSFLPPFSPLLVPMRAAVGEAGAGEIALAVLVMVATIVGLVRLAARLYSGSVLRFGARVSLRAAWRSSN